MRGWRTWRLSFSILATVAAVQAQSQLLAQTSPAAEAVTKKIVLFNGRNLDGWTSWLVDSRQDDPRRVFTVENGQIKISGDGFGYLSTRRSFRDYQLTLEFRWGASNWRSRRGAARDSGVFLHSVGPDGNSLDGNGAFKAAIECQVMEGAIGDFLLIQGKNARGEPFPVSLTAKAASIRDADGWPYWDPLGQPVTLRQTGRVNWRDKDRQWRDTFGFRGRHDPQRPRAQWNQLRCVCDDRQISVWLNGVQINQAFNAQPSSGTILLQCEGSEIFFRNVKLQPLQRSSPNGASP